MVSKKRKLPRILALLLLVCVLILLIGCQRTARKQTEDSLLIGVCAYNTDYEEMQLFMNYYREYIAGGMEIDFLFSESLHSGEEERDFIRQVKELGADGIISFYGQEIGETLQLCEEEEIYYVLASGSISDEDFTGAEDNPWFLGTIGPSTEEEYRAGYEMVQSFLSQGAASFLLVTGGAPQENYMHSTRLHGMLDALRDTGATLSTTNEEVAACTEVTTLTADGDAFSIVLCPGYLSTEEGQNNLTKALALRDYDAAACVLGLGDRLDEIITASESWGHTVRVGVVDCFSEGNRAAFWENDSYGEPKLNYIAGKYASLAGPAVSAVYNAATGHEEAVRDNGKPFRLSQALWHADNPTQYQTLYGFTQGIYENAYSCDELMQVIAVFHPETTFDDFARLTQASDVEAVEARILGR
jgi:hypothetical protein